MTLKCACIIQVTCLLLLLTLGVTANGQSNQHDNLRTNKVNYSAVLMSHLKMLTSKDFNGRKVGTEGHQLTQNYITKHFDSDNTFSKMSHLTEQSYFYSQSFNYKKGLTQYSGKNLAFIKYGYRFPKQYIVITAHYDHLGKSGGQIYPGADDNASGTSVLLTLKPWLRQLNTAYSVILLATDAEEPGLYGAKAFLKESDFNPQDIILNINLDMIGHGVKSKFLYVSGTKKQRYLNDIIESTNLNLDIKFKPKEILSSDNFRNKTRIDLHKASDHYEFYKQGIPYLFITGENHSKYHTPLDSFSTIKPNFYRKVFESIQLLVINSDQYFTTLTAKSLL